MSALIVLTSQGLARKGGARTGFSISELAVVYYALAEVGADLVLASPCGGMPPIDPLSEQAEPAHVARLMGDWQARSSLSDTLKLEQIAPEDFRTAIFVGGPGALWDLPNNLHAMAIVAALRAAEAPLGFLSHGAGVLTTAADGAGVLIAVGRRVAILTPAEQAAAGGGPAPYGLADELSKLGAQCVHGADGASWIVSDDGLITGQNTASAAEFARTMIAALA